MILRDYGNGEFPRDYTDEQATFEAEKGFAGTVIGMGETWEELKVLRMRKPFFFGPGCRKYLYDYILMQEALVGCGVVPPGRLLEVGCGSGWVAEFFTLSGFDVLATTLNPRAGESVEDKRKSLEVKGVCGKLEFRDSAMEYIHETVSDLPPFDAVYVYEALHHAHDWRKTIDSFYQCVRPGGWCFIFNEPNVIHTLVSYRIGKLSNTHEIGINPRALKKQLREAGFDKIKILKNRFHWWSKPLWIAAQRGED